MIKALHVISKRNPISRSIIVTKHMYKLNNKSNTKQDGSKKQLKMFTGAILSYSLARILPCLHNNDREQV